MVWLLDAHPVTAAMLVAVGWFPSKKIALRRLGLLVRRGRIRLVGTVGSGPGRPEHVYCRWFPKADQLRHEVELTRLCLALDAGEVRRGPQVTDADLRPDAEVTINGQLYFLELDRATTGAVRLVRERLSRYEGCPHLVLWVCPTVSRREALRGQAASVRQVALFATFAEAVSDPHAHVWVDFDGNRAALPRQQGESFSPGEKPVEKPGDEVRTLPPTASGGLAPPGAVA